MRDCFRAVVVVLYRASLTVYSSHERTDIDWLLELRFRRTLYDCILIYDGSHILSVVFISPIGSLQQPKNCPNYSNIHNNTGLIMVYNDIMYRTDKGLFQQSCHCDE